MRNGLGMGECSDCFLNDRSNVATQPIKANRRTDPLFFRFFLKQIHDKQYAAAYRDDPRKKILVGVQFSETARNLGEWLVEEEA